VVNHVETESNKGEEYSSYAEFKEYFGRVKQEEKKVFSRFTRVDENQKVVPCDETSQCTSQAVINKMDAISFNMIFASITRNNGRLEENIAAVESRILTESAPPLELYDRLRPNKAGRQLISQEFNKNFAAMAEDYFKNEARLFADDGIRSNFIEVNLGGWPDREERNVRIHKHHRGGMAKVEGFAHAFISTCFEELTSMESLQKGCFGKSPFHCIERFPELCTAIQRQLSSKQTSCCNKAKEAVRDYMEHSTRYSMPESREELEDTLVRLEHIAVCSLAEEMEVLADCCCASLMADDKLFEEAADFIGKRLELESEPVKLLHQVAMLERCKGLQSNEQLREMLEGFIAKPLPLMDEMDYLVKLWAIKGPEEFASLRE
jgi:hypothetical protein